MMKNVYIYYMMKNSRSKCSHCFNIFIKKNQVYKNLINENEKIFLHKYHYLQYIFRDNETSTYRFL